ncbi:hypothetical protein CBR_g19911 [Chara braunii]|uniref:CCHC-type domain-containing protein n=1 Tax=Chara braunii TaxID=69332 RepID=A0A388KZ27_CHABU|nr:hypothetical protein CBR_g19911 [Chara braunii]|eukprot:GBG75278.1 hypothetical protein CBR_g19911 [Chara braunii]
MASDHHDSSGQGSSRDRGQRRDPMTCYACGEEGHYSTQCKNPRPGWRGARPSSSYDSRQGRSSSPRRSYRDDREVQSQMRDIGRSVALMREYIEADRAAKEAKARLKEERKEAERREQELREAKARKAKKKANKAKLEEQRIAAMKKDMDIQVKLTVKEAMKDVLLGTEIPDALVAAKLLESKGKQKVTYASDDEYLSDFERVSGEAEEIPGRTGKLTIQEKRKRGPDPVFEDSPLMELQAKRTPKRTPRRGTRGTVHLTPRMTRSKTKSKVRLSPNTKEKIKAAAKRKIPASCGIVGRYKFRDEVIHQLKILDAITLQNICNEEGVSYNGKIDAIFDLVDHWTHIAYCTEEKEAEHEEVKPEEEEVTSADEADEGNENVN